MKKGIDVSRWQGDINWTKVKSQVDFAIIKCGGSDAGTYRDGKFERNYSEAKKNGVPIGAYWFTKATTVNAAKNDAEAFAKYVSGKNFELPLFLDIERTESGSNANTVITTFLDTLKNKGYRVGLYTYYSYWKQFISNSVLNKYDVWLADYRKGKNYSTQFAIHQYSSTGRILGISGNVDMNYLYKEDLIQKAGTITKQTTKPTKTATDAKPEVHYCSYIDNRWLGEINGISGKGENAYSGIENKPVKGFAVKMDNTKISYRVHKLGGDWYSWITDYNMNDWNKGVAGNKEDIDAIQIKIESNSKYKLRLRVSYAGRKTYLPWVNAGPWTGVEEKDTYAGVFGKAIDKVQIEVI